MQSNTHLQAEAGNGLLHIAVTAAALEPCEKTRQTTVRGVWKEPETGATVPLPQLVKELVKVLLCEDRTLE